MNQARTTLGMGTLAATSAARRDIRPVDAGHAVKIRQMSWVAVTFFIFVHMPLALLMKSFPAVGTAHALLALAVGIKWAWSGEGSH